MAEHLILASQSPRRKRLLTEAGFHFKVHPAQIEEIVDSSWTPEECAQKLARQKAEHVLRKLSISEIDGPEKKIILAADTVVALDGKIFGKPKNDEHGYEMLRALSHNIHSVITGVCLWPLGEIPLVDRDVTYVKMRPMTDCEIREYVASGEGRDKAGSYAIQETADRFIDSIDGAYDNVVGLPIQLVKRLLNQIL